MQETMIHLSSEADTEYLARVLAKSLPKTGVTIGLSGGLGAGKTTLVRYFTKALHILTPVSSPTYVLQHEYRSDTLRVEHWDLYRLSGASEELYEPMGLGEYRFIEWIERLEEQEIPLDLILSIEVDHEHATRQVTISGPLAAAVMDEWSR